MMFAGILKDYDEDEWDYYEEDGYGRDGSICVKVKGTGPYGIGGQLIQSVDVVVIAGLRIPF